MATTIEVFADPACPFAYVGLLRLRQRCVSLGREDVAVRVRAWPLELVNGRPLDPAHVAANIAALRAQVVPDLFAGFTSASLPATSLPALALVAHAYAVDMATGEGVDASVRCALFERGLDIGDLGVLHALATDAGIYDANPHDAALVLKDWHEGQRRGVVGSPHFFADGLDAFCPSLHLSREGGELSISADREAFDRFIDAALSS